jgi:hypothetical protein
MIGSGLRAVLMKVAGLGLRVEDVGKELSVMRPRLAKLVGYPYDSAKNAFTFADVNFRKRCIIPTWPVKVENTKPSPLIVLCSTNQYSCESRNTLQFIPILTIA